MDTALLARTDFREALDRDSRRFVNDPARCWDCRLVEACDCGTRWAHVERHARDR